MCMEQKNQIKVDLVEEAANISSIITKKILILMTYSICFSVLTVQIIEEFIEDSNKPKDSQEANSSSSHSIRTPRLTSFCSLSPSLCSCSSLYYQALVVACLITMSPITIPINRLMYFQ
jgi:hypothetical protein